VLDRDILGRPAGQTGGRLVLDQFQKQTVLILGRDQSLAEPFRRALDRDAKAREPLLPAAERALVEGEVAVRGGCDCSDVVDPSDWGSWQPPS
jgi:hypothetical protein